MTISASVRRGWGQKQRRVYRLDEDGIRVMGEDGKPLFDAVPTTDWGSPATPETFLLYM